MHVNETILQNMDKHGGSFIKNLSSLYRSADPLNKAILRNVFARYFEEYKNKF